MRCLGHRLGVLACGLAVLMVWPSVAAAQSRSRAITASATIVGGPHSDLLAAEALVLDAASSDPSFAETATTGDAWRITGSRGQQLSIQVETGGGATGVTPAWVAICEQRSDSDDEACRAHRVPAVRVTADGDRPDIVVRVEQTPVTGAPSATPASILVTISYITG